MGKYIGKNYNSTKNDSNYGVSTFFEIDINKWNEKNINEMLENVLIEGDNRETAKERRKRRIQVLLNKHSTIMNCSLYPFSESRILSMSINIYPSTAVNAYDFAYKSNAVFLNFPTNIDEIPVKKELPQGGIDQVYMDKIKFYLNLMENVFNQFQCEFGWGDNFDYQLGFERKDPRRNIFGVNYYGKNIVKEIGRDKIFSLQGHIIKEMPWGGIIVQLDENPYIDIDEKTKKIIENIFWDKTKVDYNNAIDSYRLTIESAMRERDLKKIVNAYYEMGNLQEKIGDYQGALESNKKAIKYGTLLSDWNMITRTYYSNGLLEEKQMRFKDAIKSYRCSIEFGNKVFNWEILGSASCNLANLQYKLKKYQDAIKSSKNAVDFSIKASNWKMMANAYYIMGSSQASLFDRSTMIPAIDSYMSAITLRDNLFDKGTNLIQKLTGVICAIGLLNLKENKKCRAEEYAKILAQLHIDGKKDGTSYIIADAIKSYQFGQPDDNLQKLREFIEIYEEKKRSRNG